MRLTNIATTGLSIVLAAILLDSATAHSWVDCVKYNQGDGSCTAYPRGYIGRDNGADRRYTYRLEGKPMSAPICDPAHQSKPNYDPKFPMAEAKPGETLILSWTPNGHLNNAKPTKVDILYYAEPGKEFGTYGEAQSAPKAATLDFATNANCKKPEDAGHPCTGQLKVPDNLKPGNTYSFVWFWHFNSNGAEEYTTCFDIKIV